jgi:hypothetical protein
MADKSADFRLEDVIRAAGAAPSIHNSQPWKFNLDGDVLRVSAVAERSLWVGDPAARSLYVSCGAALFNARLAIRATGREPAVRLLPHPEYSFEVLALIETSPGSPPTDAERGLHDAIWNRHTNRGPYTEEPIPKEILVRLQEAAVSEHAELHLPDRAEATDILTAAANAGRELAADPEHQEELKRWIATGRACGIPAAALPSRPDRPTAPIRAADWLAAAGPVDRRRPERYERFPHIAVLTTATDEPEDWLIAGQALENVLLTATSCGLSASFLNQPIELRDMREEDPPDWPGPENAQMIMRLGYAVRPAVPVPRQSPDDLIGG